MLATVFVSPSTAASANRIGTTVVTPGWSRSRAATSVEKPEKPSVFTR